MVGVVCLLFGFEFCFVNSVALVVLLHLNRYLLVIC